MRRMRASVLTNFDLLFFFLKWVAALSERIARVQSMGYPANTAPASLVYPTHTSTHFLYTRCRRMNRPQTCSLSYSNSPVTVQCVSSSHSAMYRHNTPHATIIYPTTRLHNLKLTSSKNRFDNAQTHVVHHNTIT